MMLRRIWIFLVLMVAVATPARSEAVLRIGTDGDYPPFSYVDESGKLVGFDIDISEALCAALQRKCVIERIGWTGLIPGLLDNRFDAIVASMSITEERKKLVAFTNRYYHTPMQFVAHGGAAGSPPLAVTRGMRAAAEKETTAHYYLRDHYSGILDVRIFPSQGEAEQALLTGVVDLMLADSLVIWSVTKAHPEYETIGPAINVDEGIGIALRPGDTALLNQFNQAIARIRLDGTYGHINAKYFPFSIY